ERGGELDALCLTARQRRRGLPQPHITEPDVVQRLYSPVDLGDVREELTRLLDRHLQNLGDVLPLEAHLERLPVVALAVALLARHVNVRQEVHLDLDLPIPSAHLAPSTLDIE